MALFWGENDWLVVPEDEKDLAKRLHNLFSLFCFYLGLPFYFFYFLPQVAQLGEQHEGGRRRLHSLGLPMGDAQ